jgi:hypothetical protein
MFRTLLVKSGRFSRAAVFAGLSACHTSTPPPQTTTPIVSEPPPPADARLTPRRALLRGKITDAPSGAALAGIVVRIQMSPVGSITATTNESGEFIVNELDERDYAITFTAPDGGRYATETTVRVRRPETVLDIALEPHRVAMPKPYGAPPARRRVV